MSTLPDHEIASALKQNLLSDLPPPGIFRPLSAGLSHCGYDVTLAPEFYGLHPNATALDGTPILDITASQQIALQQLLPSEIADCNWAMIRDCNGFAIRTLVLYPGDFCLGTTQETIALPSDIYATVAGKSTLLRMGIVVHNSIIEPGFQGKITLEISNVGMDPVALPATHGICQLQFHRLASPCKHSYGSARGKYQHQRSTVGPLAG